MIMHSADLFSHCANWQRHGNYCGLSLQTAVELFQHLSGLDCVLVCCILQCCLDIRLSGFHEAQDLLIIHFSGTGSDTLEIISLYDIVLQVEDSDVIPKQIDRAVEEFFTLFEIARIQNVDRVKDDPQIPAADRIEYGTCSFRCTYDMFPDRFDRHGYASEETGMTMTAYIAKIRMDSAQELLKSTALPIQDIASLSGYDDAAYFTRLFKKKTGMSPREYRKNPEKKSSEQR